MSVISIILLIIFAIVSVVTIFIISIQSEDSTGLGGVFGGGSETAFGGQSNKTINKLTAILIGIFMFVTILYAVVNRPKNENLGRYVTETVTDSTEDAGVETVDLTTNSDSTEVTEETETESVSESENVENSETSTSEESTN